MSEPHPKGECEAPTRESATADVSGRLPLWLVCLIFFFSGGPALIYQLIWQRSLFAIYGINVESVTVIVAAFMLGLGLGSLLGGVVSKKPGVPLLLAFGIIELGIGTFGLLSLGLFEWVGSWTLGLSTVATGLVTFGLVLIPTLLMGATLPILVAYLVNRSGNVGRSVGLLYFVNTLGSAVACFLGALYLFGELGQSGSVQAAVALNFVVGAGAVAAHLRARRSGAGSAKVQASSDEPAASGAGGTGFPFGLALALVAMCGFISLSYEILWFRVYSFVSWTLAAAFSLMLGAYLAGIAFGSLGARRFCPDLAAGSKPVHVRALAVFVVLANAFGFLVVPAVAATAVHAHWAWTLPFVTLAAAMLGATFPLIAHLAVAPGPKAGAQVSYLYLANIVGSTAGSLLTGFILMDTMTMQGISVLLALLGLALGASLLPPAKLVGRQRAAGGGLIAVLALLVIGLQGPLFDLLWERLQWKEKVQAKLDVGAIPFERIIENKSGVITISPQTSADAPHIYGGGAYDGVFSTNIVRDENMIVRAYALSFLHPAPKNVLTIGLASGSWAQVLVHHPQLEKLTVVEINSGYLEAIPHYPNVASVLKHPKVEVLIDDGRRFLKRTHQKFDAIVTNTTYNWRAHSTNLLSKEFLEELRGQLAPGGVVFYNTTGSSRVQRTAATVFPHAVRVLNFVAGSDSPLQLDTTRWRQTLLRYRIDGDLVVDMTLAGHRKRVARILRGLTFGDEKSWVETRASILERTRGFAIVTDDNMGTEWGAIWY